MQISSYQASVKCRKCDTVVKFRIPEEGIKKYQQGALIQDAFPHLSPSQREMLMTQTCDRCWYKLFPKGE